MATQYEKWYKGVTGKPREWVKEGILESYKVVTSTYKTQVAGVVGGGLSWMVAQLASDATIIPLRWNLSIVFGVLCLATFIHLRMLHKVSIINARMDGLTGANGPVFSKVEVQAEQDQ